jgi:hypothetical protein
VARTDVFDYIERFHNPSMQRRIDVQDPKFYALTISPQRRGRTQATSSLGKPSYFSSAVQYLCGEVESALEVDDCEPVARAPQNTVAM